MLGALRRLPIALTTQALLVVYDPDPARCEFGFGKRCAAFAAPMMMLTLQILLLSQTPRLSHLKKSAPQGREES